MAKYKISATTFNGNKIAPEIEIFIQNYDKTLKDIVPLMVYSEVINSVKKELHLTNFSCSFISKDLENLQRYKITVDTQSLTNVLIPLALDFAKASQDHQNSVVNQSLMRVRAMYQERKHSDAKELFETIDQKLLSSLDRDKYFLMQFKLILEKSEEDFAHYLELFANNPKKIKECYFEYIKYLENRREEYKPTQLLEEFEKRYPLSMLSEDELALYYYLKGRAQYRRGDFLLALKNLSEALTYVAQDDKILRASIYNTATNSFNDNLFFYEAKELANKAFTMRDKLKLPQKQESLSLLGGIYFKSGQFKKSYKTYTESMALLNDDNPRALNYLAKTSIMLGYNSKAKEYLKRSQQYPDSKGFVILLELLYLFQKKDFEQLIELYKTTVMLPENRRDYDKFVCGWSYAILARASFDKKQEYDGIEYLYKSIDYFLKDKYILEAFYVSLYIYQYGVSQNEMVRFQELLQEFHLPILFKEFVEKHAIISTKYANIFEIKSDKKNNLETFYNDTKDITADNYNPAIVKDILQSYCLI